MGLRAWATSLKRDVIALWIAARDPRVPWHVKALAGAVAAYALSPIDLIPDFIPVLGLLDDLVLLPLGIALCLKLLPADVMAECRERARESIAKPRSYLAAAVIALLWIAALVLLGWWAHGVFTSATGNVAPCARPRERRRARRAGKPRPAGARRARQPAWR